MKFGRQLERNLEPEWADHYVHYKALKKIIKKLAKDHAISPLKATNPITGGVSMSVSANLNWKAFEKEEGEELHSKSKPITQDFFFMLIEKEIKTVQDFTEAQVAGIQEEVARLDRDVGVLAGKLTRAQLRRSEKARSIKARVNECMERYLALERYVNLNFMAFSKILKKHDKNLPNPCKPFYMARLHNQRWIKGDHSAALVAMSRIHGALRADHVAQASEAAAQDFVRSTTKYWVRPEDVSRVKYTVLQHLPVFLQNTMDGRSDSQLLNSVYLDNAQMELYHGRMDKLPGAIALRLRWYGTGLPKLVFVERKTHKDAWTGEASVKERFTVGERDVQSVFEGTYDIQAEVQKMRAKGKSEADVANWEKLATECCQQIKYKQLVPTMRTQYMRTAFQIPFDASVRVSLDTNLTMFYERINEGDVWYRDPKKPVPPSEITRFPHAILEVKLMLKDESLIPDWVTDLLSSGLVVPFHKYSKFIHGCAVLMSEDVQYMPYWIDDPTIRQSIIDSGSEHILKDADKGANKIYQHLLPDWSLYEHMKKDFLARNGTPGGAGGGAREEWSPLARLAEAVLPCFTAFGRSDKYRFALQKVEPKLVFASERVAIHWLHYSVTISSIATGILAFSKQGSRASNYALLILPVAFLYAAYSVHIHFWRTNRINTRVRERWDDPRGPVILVLCLVAALTVMFVSELYIYLGLDI